MEEGVRRPLGFYSFTGKRTERGSLSPNQNWKKDDTKKKKSPVDLTLIAATLCAPGTELLYCQITDMLPQCFHGTE